MIMDFIFSNDRISKANIVQRDYYNQEGVEMKIFFTF